MSKSGDGARKKPAPHPYKYAAELAFLKDIMASETTIDNMAGSQQESSDSDTVATGEVTK
jgi:hypothetical protein